MKSFLWIAFGAMLTLTSASAQTAASATAADAKSEHADNAPQARTATADASADAAKAADNVPLAQAEEPGTEAGDASESSDNPKTADTISTSAKPQYVPMTASERARKYILGAFGPGAILRAGAAGGISQWTKTPKEWGEGPDAFGDRFGNAFAKHVIREALEYGASAALREDNRYFRSIDSGFGKRSKHAIASVFLARNEAGGERFAYSRFGAVLGSAFISRVWQPRSEDKAGDALVSFGLTMAADIGFNFFREFCPKSLGRRLKIR